MAVPTSNMPASGAKPVTKGVAFNPCRALWIGTAGTLNFTTADGNVLTDFPAQAGILPVAAASVQASGTADDIWALY
jgi:hypothetical protein